MSDNDKTGTNQGNVENKPSSDLNPALQVQTEQLPTILEHSLDQTSISKPISEE